MNKRHDEVVELAGIIQNKMCYENYIFSDVAAIDAADEILNPGYHKTIWHKVADGDFPTDKKRVLIYAADGAHYIGFYNPVYNAFYPDNVTWYGNSWPEAPNKVIAWTELPTYEE